MANLKSNFIPGTKFVGYDEHGVFRTFRFYKYKNDETLSFKDIATGASHSIDIRTVLDKLVMVTQDAFMNIMLTDENELPDVYVCINKSANLSSGSVKPNLILRQSVMNTFKGMNEFGKISVGECFTDFSDDNMNTIFEFTTIDHKYSYAVYVDDTIDTILDTIVSTDIEAINNYLTEIKKKMDAIFPYDGYETSLKDLMENNRFLACFRGIFNIMQIDGIKIDQSAFDEEGITKSIPEYQKKAIEDMIRKYIKILFVMKYDRDIDVSKIVETKHIMISDEDGKIYLVAYEEIGDYVVDSDIAKAFKVVQ